MKTNNRGRKSVSIGKTRWAAYATAGAATMLTTASSADAEIHYSGRLGVYFGPDSNESATFPLGEARAFILLGHQTFFSRSFFGVEGLRSDAFLGYTIFEYGYPSKLHRGNRYISQFRSFVTFYNYQTILFDAAHRNGEFHKKGSGFVGFRFDNGAGAQYGWARVYMNGDGDGFIFVDYAYGDAGDRIKPGQTSSSSSVALPKPANTNSVAGSLGLLAFGSQGLDAWRAQRTPESN